MTHATSTTASSQVLQPTWIDHTGGRSLATVQSNYIPWLGYFDIMNAVDIFVLLDEVQYTRRDWRNRNRIRGAGGSSRWLTIPVQVKGRYTQRVDETLVTNPDWAHKHWQTLQHTYGSAPYFAQYESQLQQAYERAEGMQRLSDINRMFIELCCAWLGIRTQLQWSTEYDTREGRNERLISMCEAAGAQQYLSGPSAHEYLDLPAFARAGVQVRYADYSGYPSYPQMHGGFDPAVTVLDPLFNLGPDARQLLRSVQVRDV